LDQKCDKSGFMPVITFMSILKWHKIYATSNEIDAMYQWKGHYDTKLGMMINIRKVLKLRKFI